MNLKKLLFSKKITSIFTSIRSGMLYAMPIFIIGSIGLVIMYLPNDSYQRSINSIFNGNFIRFLNIINNMTLSIASIILTATVAYSRSKYYNNNTGDMYYVIIAIMSFICLSDFNTSSFSITSFNVQGVFIALLSSIISTSIYHEIIVLLKRKTKLVALGIDNSFNKAISILIPFFIVVLIFSLFRIILYAFNIYSIEDSLASIFINMYKHVKYDYLKGLLYVFLVSFLWFFGLHGGNVLEASIEGNLDNINSGIFSKSFHDVFIIMGGCGSAICLLIAIFIVSKNKRLKKVAYTATPFSIFNISEIAIFGVPIILNPIFIIPFTLVPFVNYTISYLAIYLHIVPIITTEVMWTCPIFLSGYIATGSISGIFLQMFNIIVGIFIYGIFIKINDKIFKQQYAIDVKNITNQYYESIGNGLVPELLSNDNHNRAQLLAVDIYKALNKGKLEIYFQPQTKTKGICYGGEALLRYNHPELGYIDPPIIIQLAKEANFINELETYIVNKVLDYRFKYNCGLISFNITAKSFINESFIDYIINKTKELKLNHNNIAIEITEETILSGEQLVKKSMNKLKENNISVILDDFGMGHTSLLYLKTYTFDTIKIAGEIIKDCETNNNSKQIIKSIVDLGKELNFQTTAEYVESKQCLDLLDDLNITNIQGYIYSKPLSQTEFAIYYLENKAK